MEVILNDFSVAGQFASCDEFTDYILDEMTTVLDCMIEKRIPFLKRQDFYSCRITEALSLNDILLRANDPAIAAIRKYISELAYHEPYWDKEILSKGDVKYKYPAEGKEPNCFTEVIERNGALLSFPSKTYAAEHFICYRNEKMLSIFNIMGKRTFFNTYIKDNMEDIKYVLENYPYQISVTLAEIKGKCYAQEALLGNRLDITDIQNILLSISWMMDGMRNGVKNDYWDSLRDGIFEFRVRVSDNRIFRLLFFQDGGIVFLNGFIKKTQKTPPNEIEKALKIKRILV